MTLMVLRSTGQVGCTMTLTLCVWWFFVARLRLSGFGRKTGGKVPFSRHHIKSSHYQQGLSLMWLCGYGSVCLPGFSLVKSLFPPYTFLLIFLVIFINLASLHPQSLVLNRCSINIHWRAVEVQWSVTKLGARRMTTFSSIPLPQWLEAQTENTGSALKGMPGSSSPFLTRSLKCSRLQSWLHPNSCKPYVFTNDNQFSFIKHLPSDRYCANTHCLRNDFIRSVSLSPFYKLRLKEINFIYQWRVRFNTALYPQWPAYNTQYLFI